MAAYNKRAERPTAWQMEVHTGADFFERMLRERPGNAVIHVIVPPAERQ